VNLGARWWAVWAPIFGAPLVTLLFLLFVRPDWDRPIGTSSFHFYVVSATALAALVACGIVVGLIRSMRETRLLFLGLAFMWIAAVFSVHGLATPGHIHAQYHSEIAVSSWLSVAGGGLFVALSALALPERVENIVKRWSTAFFTAAALGLGLYIGLSMTSPTWLDWAPTDKRSVQLLMTALTLALLGFAALRYYQAFLFARLPSQWALVSVMVLLMEVQLSMTFGHFWQISWWLYHGLYAGAFVILFGAWAIEARRAGNVAVLADALSMRDAVSQLNHGYTQPIAELVDAIEWKDLYTLGHVRRVASYAVMMGKEMGLSTIELRRLALGAQMHDVGKIGVPDKILTKPGPLNDEDFAEIKRHVYRGYEIAKQVKALEPAADAIYFHHEKMDGSGYPLGLAGDDIPLHARIVSVADAFDAMTSGRVYQSAVSDGAALAELRRCSGTHFDPACVEAFNRVLQRLGENLAATPGAAPRPQAA
jgi:HD-GYP domain-containing protein (c-di-GMP phosphodiesterase class II)